MTSHIKALPEGGKIDAELGIAGVEPKGSTPVSLIHLNPQGLLAPFRPPALGETREVSFCLLSHILLIRVVHPSFNRHLINSRCACHHDYFDFLNAIVFCVVAPTFSVTVNILPGRVECRQDLIFYRISRGVEIADLELIDRKITEKPSCHKKLSYLRFLTSPKYQ
jgi:hypothetical protein